VIDILIPVLGRPQNAQAVVDSIHASTSVSYEIWFICSAGDTEQTEAAWRTDAHRVVIEDFGERSQYPKKMNRGFHLSQNPFLLLGADDLDFESGWDLEALKVAQFSGASVIGTNDLANRQVMKGLFSTHPLVRRSYLENPGGSCDGPGTLIHEGYDHNYCERELCHLAQLRGQWAFARASHIRHRHPCWGTAPSDATYAKGRESMLEDLSYFFQRSSCWDHVGLTAPEKAALRYAARQRRRKTRQKIRR
jgi:glycosyltransferase involved in cell wall biosynthesis